MAEALPSHFHLRSYLQRHAPTLTVKGGLFTTALGINQDSWFLRRWKDAGTYCLLSKNSNSWVSSAVCHATINPLRQVTERSRRICLLRWILDAIMKLWPSQRDFPKIEINKQTVKIVNEALPRMEVYALPDWVCRAEKNDSLANRSI